MKLHITYIKIVVAGSDPAQGNIVILHAATIPCCKATAHQPVVLHLNVKDNLLLLYIQVSINLSPKLTVVAA